ncbi:hypothetical protein SKP52_14370 [Sphingopyxis fribergensis]|uniref:Crp/Fnr family transcriptional regulator n=2 Tax=Sphingopyxis fribergensis TaxID=1515612 RepID=A0A0A7PKM2_9SPHN|nr:hypothetical protein SKP52_14370 [Sphingopyxis fribergensis]
MTDMPPAIRSRIMDSGRTMSVNRGQRIFAYGDPPGGIYGILSGGIGMEACSGYHSVRLGHIMREGDWFGHGPALERGVRSLGCRAVEDSLLWTVPLPALITLMQDDPETSRFVGELASANARILTYIACDLLIPSAPRRMAAVLLRVTGALEGVRPSDPEGYLLTQSELGEMANVSRHHVNRVLGQFMEKGWVTKSYNRLRLLDIPSLADFAFHDE